MINVIEGDNIKSSELEGLTGKMYGNPITSISDAIAYLEAKGLYAKELNTLGNWKAFSVGREVEYIRNRKSVFNDNILVIQDPADRGLWAIEKDSGVVATKFTLDEIIDDVLQYYGITK